MPVRRDSRTGGWFFRTTVKTPDGKKLRLFGTPGVPGPYQDLAATKVGAQEAEQRAIKDAFAGATGAVTPPENPWRLQAWLGHKRIDETMLYVHVAEDHRREIPEAIVAAGRNESDPDRRILRMLGGVAANLDVSTERLMIKKI